MPTLMPRTVMNLKIGVLNEESVPILPAHTSNRYSPDGAPPPIQRPLLFLGRIPLDLLLMI
jgi:hypothetical protein